MSTTNAPERSARLDRETKVYRRVYRQVYCTWVPLASAPVHLGGHAAKLSTSTFAVPPAGLEPAAYRLGGGRSIHLSYEGADATVAGHWPTAVGHGLKRRSGDSRSGDRDRHRACADGGRSDGGARRRASCTSQRGLAVRSAA